MSRPSENGYIARRIHLHLADACVANARLIAAQVDDVLDNDPNNIEALRRLNDISRNNMAIFHVENKLADGELTDAATLAENMNKLEVNGRKKASNGAAKKQPKEAVKP